MSKEHRPAFLFYASDWLSSTQDMNAATRGMYHALLCHQWLRGSLPNQIDRLWRLAGADSKEEFSNAWAMLVHRFSIAENMQGESVLQNERLEAIRRATNEKSDKATKRATDAANARWGKKEDASSNAQAMPNTMLKNANKEDEDENEDNSIIVEHPYNGGTSVTYQQGGAGGNGKIPPDFIDSIYTDFVAAYGKTKNAVQQFKIQQELLAAVIDCMDRKGVSYNEAGKFLIWCADLANQTDAKNRNAYRLSPQNWLAQRCYHSNPLENVVEVAEKESPSEKLARQMAEFQKQHQHKKAQEAGNNGK